MYTSHKIFICYVSSISSTVGLDAGCIGVCQYPTMHNAPSPGMGETSELTTDACKFDGTVAHCNALANAKQ
jgi:hypothetical protein